MSATFSRPTYPDLFLAKTWDKKKSLLAKAQVKNTGVGEAMEEAKKAFDAVKWENLEGLNDCKWETFSVDAWNTALVEAKSEATSNLRKFQLALDNIRDVAKGTEKRLAEKKLKSDVKLAQDIASEADALGGKMHANVVLPVLIAAHRDNKAPYEDIIKNASKKIIETVGKVVGAMQVVKDSSYDPKVFNANVGKVRDVAQTLGNIKNYLGKGFTINISADEADKLYLEMSGWRNGNPQFPDGTPAQTVNLEVHKIRDAMRRTLLAFK